MPSMLLSRLCCGRFLGQRSHNHIRPKIAMSRAFRSIVKYPGCSSLLLGDSYIFNHHNFSQLCRSLSIYRSRTTISSAKNHQITTLRKSSDPIPSLRTKWAGKHRMASDKKNVFRQSKIIPFWQRLLFVSGVGAVIYYIFKDALHEKEIESEETRYQELVKAQLGGNWTLTDHNGNRRSASEFHGQWVLLYFGFTHCPDICPEELEKLIQIVNRFKSDPYQTNIQPLFISVDPERDSPKTVKEYCAEYSPDLIGFTGSEEEIREVCKKFRVYFGKGERDENNDYIVDHTIIIYLLNPYGEFVNYFGRNLTADNIHTAVVQHIARYKELEQKGKLEVRKRHTLITS